MADHETFDDPEGALGEFLRFLREAAPDEATHLENRVRESRRESGLASMACIDLRAAVVTLALDIWRDNGAEGHVRKAVEAFNSDTFNAEERINKSLSYLASALGATPEEVQDVRGFFEHKFKNRIVNSGRLNTGDSMVEMFRNDLIGLQDAIKSAESEANQPF